MAYFIAVYIHVENGLARYYDPNMGRFQSMDPITDPDKAYSPAGLNAYQYGLNNPCEFIDPLGLWAFGLGLVVSWDKTSGFGIGAGFAINFGDDSNSSSGFGIDLSYRWNENGSTTGNFGLNCSFDDIVIGPVDLNLKANLGYNSNSYTGSNFGVSLAVSVFHSVGIAVGTNWMWSSSYADMGNTTYVKAFFGSATKGNVGIGYQWGSGKQSGSSGAFIEGEWGGFNARISFYNTGTIAMSFGGYGFSGSYANGEFNMGFSGGIYYGMNDKSKDWGIQWGLGTTGQYISAVQRIGDIARYLGSEINYVFNREQYWKDVKTVENGLKGQMYAYYAQHPDVLIEEQNRGAEYAKGVMDRYEGSLITHNDNLFKAQHQPVSRTLGVSQEIRDGMVYNTDENGLVTVSPYEPFGNTQSSNKDLTGTLIDDRQKDDRPWYRKSAIASSVVDSAEALTSLGGMVTGKTQAVGVNDNGETLYKTPSGVYTERELKQKVFLMTLFVAGGSGLKGGASKTAGNLTEQLAAKSGFKVVEFQGRRVYIKADIDLTLTDAKGMANLERMQHGLAPIGADGKSINLHHMLQLEPGPMLEINQTLHQAYTKQLHGLVEDGASFRNNPILRNDFSKFKKDFWIWRAENVAGK